MYSAAVYIQGLVLQQVTSYWDRTEAFPKCCQDLELNTIPQSREENQMDIYESATLSQGYVYINNSSNMICDSGISQTKKVYYNLGSTFFFILLWRNVLYLIHQIR